MSEVLSEGSCVKMETAKQHQQSQHPQQNVRKTVGVMGSRRIFAPAFKLKVLDSYRNDLDCKGNQRATARKYGIHRRQIQKWLQCEDNLRNTCAEIGSNVGSSATGNVSGISKSEGLLKESTGPGISPVSPALNLSLARLHGDELVVQQGPPPSHPPSRNSPSSPEYVYQTALPSRVTPIGYPADYLNQDQHHLREMDEKIHLQDVHKYSGDRVESERKYYVTNPDSYEFESSTGFGNKSEVNLYQPLAAYHSPQDHRYDGNDANATSDHHHHNTQHRHHHRQPHHHRNYGGIDSPGDARITRTMLHVPAEIKTERASPDSAATPGLYEIPGSPGSSKVSPSSPHQATVTNTNSPAPHFQLTRQASPLIHMHARELTHPCLSDSEKLLHQEREKGEAKTEGELELKEEVDENHIDMEVVEGEGREDMRCVDYQRPPAASSLTNSGSISPLHQRVEIYSVPPSPQDPGSSDRSSSSYSDSEMDQMDYTSLHQNSSGDLTRRRSFSLRFKLNVLDAFHRDVHVAGNQRATARKFGINRRQVQKWLGQEAELRGEIALRGGNSRQRLGPIQDPASRESPVDLRMIGIAVSHPEAEFDQCSSSLYSCETVRSPVQQTYCQPGLLDSPDTSYRTCTFSCCVENTTMTSTSCYQDISFKRPCYAELQGNFYCYSPKESGEVTTLPVNQELISSQVKRPACTLSCCYQVLPSPKRFCVESEENCVSLCPQPPQDTPLCLVKPKIMCKVPLQIEPVTSTVPTPPASVVPSAPPSKKDAILFKPYLDNPISKPSDDSGYHGHSPVNSNNNNCQSICNLNEDRRHNYALELSLRVPVAWRTHHSPYSDFPQVRSAFVRYPTSPHYT